MEKTIRLPATPDDNVWPIDTWIDTAQVGENIVNVTWQDGKISRYHNIWLRDNCACPDCVNPYSHEQTVEICNLPDQLVASRAEIDAVGALKITWSPDGHVSHFHPGWLRAYDYSNSNGPEFDRRPEIWNTSDFEPPRHDGSAYMADDAIVLEVLDALATVGVCVLDNLSIAPGTVGNVAKRIGFIQETHWGRIFDVKVIPGAASTAYTAMQLPAHTDIPNSEAPPGLQILHCLKTSVTGGESVMIDGLWVAEDMRRDFPEDFEILRSVKWEQMNRSGGDADVRWAPPVFVADKNDEIAEVRLAPFSRAPLMCDFNQVEAAFRALRCFSLATKDPKYRLIIPFHPGTAILFNNRRILHSRQPFDPSTGERHLQGCYIHKDTWLSRRRAIIRSNIKQQELQV